MRRQVKVILKVVPIQVSAPPVSQLPAQVAHEHLKFKERFHLGLAGLGVLGFGTLVTLQSQGQLFNRITEKTIQDVSGHATVGAIEAVDKTYGRPGANLRLMFWDASKVTDPKVSQDAKQEKEDANDIIGAVIGTSMMVVVILINTFAK